MLVQFIILDLVTVGKCCFHFSRGLGSVADYDNREFKKTTTATATGTSLNKRFNEQNNRCARAL